MTLTRFIRLPLTLLLTFTLIYSLLPTPVFASEKIEDTTSGSQTEASKNTPEDTSQNSNEPKEDPSEESVEGKPDENDASSGSNKDSSEEKKAEENPAESEQGNQGEALLSEEDTAPEDAEPLESSDTPLTELAGAPLISYQTHVQNIGWQQPVGDRAQAGTTNKSLRVEALKVALSKTLVGSVSYSAHVQNIGWQTPVSDGALAGTTAKSLALEAVCINLSGQVATTYDVYYRTHAQSFGWLGWAKNGEAAGSAGYSLRLEALEIVLVAKGGQAPGTTQGAFKETLFTYQTHVSYQGWQSLKTQGVTSGTTGRSLSLEALRITPVSTIYTGSIVYESYITSGGWQAPVKNGAISGTTGKSRALQTLRIHLEGTLADTFDIYYRTHIAYTGWTGWAKNSEPSGSLGYARALEALEICLVPKGSAAPGSTHNTFYSRGDLLYQTHVSFEGWQAPQADGAQAGSIGTGRQIEALSLTLASPSLKGSISYEVFVAGVGWQTPVKDGASAGTSGQGRSIEALKATLSGEAAQTHDLYYRLHFSTWKWSKWTTGGNIVGAMGCNLRVEGLEMILVPKGQSAPLGTSTMETTRVSYSLQAHVQGLGWMKPLYAGRQILGIAASSLRLEAMRLTWDRSSSIQGGISYRSHVSYVGWQEWVEDGEVSGTTRQSKQIEAVSLKLTGAIAEDFDIYYRAYVRGLGWFGWAKNGEDAGTSGGLIPLEALEVALQPKEAPALGSLGGAFREVKSLTGDAWLNAQLASIVIANSFDLRRCYNYVTRFPYISGSLWPSGAWEVPLAKEMLQRGRGNCYRYAALFCMLARQLGYDARVVAGAVPSRSQGRAPHGWVEIAINEQVYVFDPDMAHAIPSRNWYMITYANAPVTYYR